MPVINYCSAPTGAGKTYALIARFAELIGSGETVILIQPTMNLGFETQAGINNRFPTIHVEMFNQRTRGSSVVADLTQHLKQLYDQPHVIIVTWAAFIMLPYFETRGRFHLFCDEIPQAYIPSNILLPDNHSVITDALIVENISAGYGILKSGNPSVIRKLADNASGDKVAQIFSPLAKRIHERKYATYVDKRSYEGLCKGSKDDRELATFSMLSPSVFRGFRSVTLLGAGANETILFKWFSQKDVKFVEDRSLMKNMLYQAHENGHLIDFYYASETNWSKTLQKDLPELRVKYIESAAALFGSSPFCWQDNRENEETSPFASMKDASNVGHSVYGINSYQDINNAVIITALNYEKKQGGFLTDVCLMDKKEQIISLAYHNSYQTYCRTSIRDRRSHTRKIIILPDRQNAAWQQERFPGSNLLPLGIDQRTTTRFRKDKVHESATDRKRTQRDKLAREQEGVMKGLINAIDSKQEKFVIDECHGSSFNNSSSVTSLQGSIIAHKMEGDSTALICSNGRFVDNLRSFSTNSFDQKDANKLISPGLFVTSDGSTSKRSKDEAFCGRHVYLDIENGNLAHRELSKIFPTEELVAYNSFSHTKQMPRYRIVFLTDEVMSPRTYTTIYNQIVHTIERSGFSECSTGILGPKHKVHGIDRKPYLTDLFYLPCKPAEGDGFFLHYAKGRAPIDVLKWSLNLSPTRFDKDDDAGMVEASSATIVANHAAVCERSLGVFRDATIAPETSHTALRALNYTLIRAGVDDVSRDVTLTQAAQSSRSPVDRMKDKTRLMRMRSIY